MAREISSSTEYVLDDFDEEFPELYNALYQNALSGRARHTRKACELATLGRRLAAQPRFGGLRDPGRLVQRPSHAPEVAELTAALRTARRAAQLLRDEILGQTPQAKAAANARARKMRTPDRPTQSKRSAVVGTPNSGELEDLEGDAFLSADPGENLGLPSETRSRGAGADANRRRVRDRVSRPVRSPPKSSRAVLSQIVGDDAVACELAQLGAQPKRRRARACELRPASLRRPIDPVQPVTHRRAYPPGVYYNDTRLPRPTRAASHAAIPRSPSSRDRRRPGTGPARKNF